MRTAGVMQWTVRLEARTSEGEVTTTDVVKSPPFLGYTGRVETAGL